MNIISHYIRPSLSPDGLFYFMNTEIEIWKPVYGFESQYQVSNLGRIKSLGNNFSRKEKILKNIDRLNGYSTVKMSINTPQKTYRIHRLVAIAFLGLDPNQNKLVVDHIDNNKKNNRADNLQVISVRENSSKDQFRHNRSSKYVGVYKTKKNRYASSIHLGCYDTEIEAANVYDYILCKLLNYNSKKL